MKKLMCLIAAGAMAVSATASAAQPVPMPDPVAGGHHVVAGGPVVMTGAPVEMARCVKVKDSKHIACCAKPMVVQIVDPCWKADKCNKCCQPPCVAVEICVPDQCCPPKVKCSSDGRKVRYDFGKYAVDVRSKDGYVEIDYDS